MKVDRQEVYKELVARLKVFKHRLEEVNGISLETPIEQVFLIRFTNADKNFLKIYQNIDNYFYRDYSKIITEVNHEIAAINNLLQKYKGKDEKLND